MDARHGSQGVTMLVTGLVLSLLLVGLTVATGGLTLVGPVTLGFVGVLAAIGLCVGWLWNARRYGWAWALLLGLPGLALAALVTFFVMFAIGIS